MDCVLPFVERSSVSDVFLAYGSSNDEDTIIIDSDDDDDGVAANPYGLVFFHSLRVGPDYPVPRLDSTPRTLSDKSFRYLFKISFSDVGEEYFRRAPIQLLEPAMRSNNRTRLTKPYIQADDTPLPKLFNIGVRLPTPPRDTGSDIESDGDEQEVEDDADTALTKLWLQFIRDVTQKCSNRKGGDQDGYCKLPMEVRQAANENLYKNLCLSDFFNDCQWKVAREGEWESTFNHLFPLENKLTKRKLQNYRSCRYYAKWEMLKDRAAGERNMLNKFRRALKLRFDRLIWFPCAQSDRIWITRPNSPPYQKFINHEKPAPWVLVKEGRPEWEN
jgi:hypothetical protein